MPIPRLEDVLQTGDDLIERLDSDAVGRQSWAVLGDATAGKSALLRYIATHATKHDRVVALLAPSQGALDAGPVALTQLTDALQSQGGANGKLAGIPSPEVEWATKVAAVESCASDLADRLVILCDEPLGWVSDARADDAFAERAWDVIGMVSRLPCRKIFAGDPPSALGPHARIKLHPSSDPDFLEQGTWGDLGDAAAGLASASQGRTAHLSPLEVRLLVALSAIEGPLAAASYIDQGRRRRSLAARLMDLTDTRPELRDLKRAWTRLALFRRPFTENLLRRVGIELSQFDSVVRSIVTHCLLFEEGEDRIFHEMLRADAYRRWVHPERSLSAGTTRLADRLARSYIDLANAHASSRLADRMEAAHFGLLAGTDTAPFLFADHYVLLGHNLSYWHKKYAEAARAFGKAVALDPCNDYAHHYLAFNLERSGNATLPEVEQHYRDAIRLNPRNYWWHSRLILHLIAAGRLRDARIAWELALDSLALGESSEAVETFPYESLHLWVAQDLLRRGETSFASTVLAEVPPAVLRQSAELQEAKRHLDALLATHDPGAFVPAELFTPDWWARGPFLLDDQITKTMRLQRWIAARVASVEHSRIQLNAAVVDLRATDEPTYGNMDLTYSELRAWFTDYDPALLKEGQFLELGEYLDSGSSDSQYVGRAHKTARYRSVAGLHKTSLNF